MFQLPIVTSELPVSASPQISEHSASPQNCAFFGLSLLPWPAPDVKAGKHVDPHPDSRVTSRKVWAATCLQNTQLTFLALLPHAIDDAIMMVTPNDFLTALSFVFLFTFLFVLCK